MKTHNSAEFAAHGIEPLVADVRQYLINKIPRPYCTAPHYRQDSIQFTFNDHILRGIAEKPTDFVKPVEVALKYGYRGTSKGDKNGIFMLRESDQGLHKTLGKLTRQHEEEIMKEMQVTQLVNLKDVKIVWHGDQRLVGVYSTNANRMMFLGFAQY